MEETKVVTGLVRFSYMNVLKPKAVNAGDEEKYSVSLLIPKSDKQTIKRINAAIEAAKEAGKGKWDGKIPGKLKLPLRDGDEERPDDEVYANCWFVNANAKMKPSIVDKNRQPIMDESEIYSGMYGHASISFYGYNSNGSKGIACGLNHLMKVKDGEPLGGRVKAEIDFADLEVDDEDDILG